MIQYPKIMGSAKAPMKPCIAFVKYDGSNLRFEWSRKRGWSKSGTRTQMFDETHPFFGSAKALFLNTLAKPLEEIFRTNKEYRKRDQYTVFAEFFGPNSFAGMHKEKDEKQLVLFDVWKFKSGFIGPRQFIKDFKNLNIAEVVYDGKLTGQFLENVRNGKYDVEEGVVCKGGSGGKDVWMVKVKTYAYMKKLKELYNDRWKEFWEN